MKLFSGDSNKPLAESICKHLKMPLGEIYLHTFPSQEKYVQFKENIRGEDVFLIQSLSNPTNDNLMELLVMSDAARRASCGKITIVCPWMAYSRCERKDKSRVPISSKLVLDMIESAGVDRIISVDLHSPSVQGFTNKPFDNLYAMPLLIKNLNKKNMVVIAPDAGAVKRNEALARIYNAEFAFIAKRRVNDTDVITKGFVGDVNGKVAVICDDLAESCGTIIEASKICKSNGASEVWALISHPMFTEIGIQRIKQDTNLNGVITTNSIPLSKTIDKIKVVDISPLLAEAIRRTNSNESISELFEIKGF
jgi:ribose-phosphate pyrophosphokinase